MNNARCSKAGGRYRSAGYRPMIAAVVGLLVLCGELQAQPAKKTANQKPVVQSTPATTQLHWIDSLAKGYTLGQRNRRPIFVRVGTQSCPHCRRLEAEIAKSEVQKELKRWTLVSLDADKSPNDARLLAVGPVPALRLLTPAGKLVVSRDGSMSAKELVAWLAKHHDSVSVATPADELAEQGPPSVIGVVRLVREFRQRNAVLREAAIRRLMPHPDVAAFQVVAAFQEGKLSTRLAALELLIHWKAPVSGLDPWRPKTITKNGLAKLGGWATDTDFKEFAKQKKTKLTAKELGDAQREIDRMLAATDQEAAAARERLARFGKLLLPQVHTRLKSADTDRTLSRLTALRYRLVASPQLIVQWPGGLQRLAATNIPIRVRAADELSKRATLADESLLLELFSDAAPLIREIALRSLQKIAGDQANSALLKLLDDPEPNVRAAVLKQLAEKPSAAIADKVAAYSAREKDTDLLVHVVRVLREVKSEKPAKALIALLKHKSWRVRSEAAEGIGKIVYAREWLEDRSGSPFGGFRKSETTDDKKSATKRAEREKLKSDATAALVKLLEDNDAFVISRAMKSLGDSGKGDLVGPLVKVADRKRALAPAVVKMLAGSGFRSKALPDLRRYASHKSAQVRAVAVAGLIAESISGSEKELKVALKDQTEVVRIAATNALYGKLAELFRSHSSQNGRSRSLVFPGGFGSRVTKTAKTPDPEKALKDVRAGKVFSKETVALAGFVKPLLKAKSADERLSASLVLAQLGRDKAAVPVLLQLARARGVASSTLSNALQLLLWKDRATLFDALVKHARDVREVESIAQMLAYVPDKRAVDRVWKLFVRRGIDAQFSGSMLALLQLFYFGEQHHQIAQVPLARRKKVAEQMIVKAKAGPRWQRITALTILTTLDRSVATEIAEGIFDDSQQSDEFRIAAYRLILRSSPQSAAQKRAAANLQSKSAAIRNQSLAFLALGIESAKTLSDGYGMNRFRSYAFRSRSGFDRLIYPEAPRVVQAGQIERLLKSGDAKTRAIAGYLLVLLDRPSGLQPLLDYWRTKAQNDRSVRKLVYRALSHLDEPQSLPILKQIYVQIRKADDGSISDFYWTVRIMTGRKSLAFRKRIRAEVGMDNL